MGELRVLLVGEGRSHELGGYRDEFARADALPPLAALVKRLLPDHAVVRFFCRLGSQVGNVHQGKMASRWGKKVFTAIWYARHGRAEPLDAVVLVADRDGPRNAARLREMQEGRDSYGPSALPCALGVPVEMFDAWMIADTEAIEAAVGDAARAQPCPEALADPKAAADAIFETRRGAGLGPKYAIVAREVDLDALAKTCPQGFAPFAQEVRERIGPVVRRA